MFYAAKSINKNSMAGRTISGLYTELLLHYMAYKLYINQTIHFKAKEAGMGSAFKGSYGYDSNAWFFEGANTIRIGTNINNYTTNRAFYNLIKDIARYF